jgi:hypothetical protein
MLIWTPCAMLDTALRALTDPASLSKDTSVSNEHLHLGELLRRKIHGRGAVPAAGQFPPGNPYLGDHTARRSTQKRADGT